MRAFTCTFRRVRTGVIFCSFKWPRPHRETRAFFANDTKQAWIDPRALPKGDALKQWGIELTELASSGKLDPVIGKPTSMISMFR